MKMITLSDAARMFSHLQGKEFSDICMRAYNAAVDKHNSKRYKKKRLDVSTPDNEPGVSEWNTMQEIIAAQTELTCDFKQRIEDTERDIRGIYERLDKRVLDLRDLSNCIGDTRARVDIKYVELNQRIEKLEEHIANHYDIDALQMIQEISKGCKEFEDRIANLESCCVPTNIRWSNQNKYNNELLEKD